MQKFNNSPAGEAWFIFKHTGNIEDARMLIDETIEFDKSCSQIKEPELEF